MDYARGVASFAVLTIIGVGVFYLGVKGLIGEYRGNIVSTVFGFVLTIVILEKRNNRKFKERLIRQMGSDDRGVAAEAVRLLKQRVWQLDGSLKKAVLFKANLQEADLTEANLRGACLSFVHLTGANLSGANLQGADLFHASLQGADLSGANLRGANLMKANLEETRIWQANLKEDRLEKIIFTLVTILPDGSH